MLSFLKISTLTSIVLLAFLLIPADVGAQAAIEDGEAVGFDTIGGIVYDGLTSIGGLAIALGGRLLDASLSGFVFSMADTTREFGIDGVINEVWKMVRDLFNLLFIFGLVFIGFKMILGVDDSGSKRTIVTLIIAALLINFSLYVTKVVIDFSNVAASQIGSQLVSSASTRSTVFGIEIKNISSGFLAATDIQSISSTSLSMVTEMSSGVIALPTTSLSLRHALVMGLTIALMFVLIGFVFIAGALIMFTRFVYLIFLMMFSPLMFLGWILPGFSQRSKDWWHKLFYQAFVGPAYLFTLLIALKVLQGLMNTGVASGDNSLTAFLLSCLIVSAFVWAALIVSQKMGAAGATIAIKTGESWGKSVRGGVTGMAGRNLIGSPMHKWNESLEKKGVSENSIRRRLASSLAGNKFGSSYSASQQASAEEKAEVKRARYDQIHGKREGDRSILGIVGPRKRKGGIAAAVTSGMTAKPGDDSRIEMEKAVTGASNEQVLELLKQHKPESTEYKAVVATISAAQFDSAMKSKAEEFDDAAKEALGGERKRAVEQAVRQTAIEKVRVENKDPEIKLEDRKVMKSGIRNASEAQLKVLGLDVLKEHAVDLKQGQFDDIMKSKDYTETEKAQIKAAREQQMKEMFDTEEGRKELFKGLQDKDIASLPKDIILDERSIEYISGGALRKMAEDDKITDDERGKLKDNIRKHAKRKDSAVQYLRTPQGQERYGVWKDEKTKDEGTEEKTA